MVCTYCGSSTRVINSRHQRKSNQVWRRRACDQCQATFTSEEGVKHELAWVVWRSDGTFQPFSRDKLLLSLHQSCEHRPQALSDAQGLTATILRKLPANRLTASDSRLSHRDIARLTLVTLTRFDQAAAVRYQSLHRNSLPAKYP